jgi:hypothetical protein
VLAGFDLGAGSEVPVPCWFCDDVAFSLCVFGEESVQEQVEE